MSNIDPHSPIPIYHQLKTLIREKIELGVWRPGDRIPTEQELCRMYHISRTPVRQALNELEFEGLIVRRPGYGTYVSERTAMQVRIMSSDSELPRILERISQAWNTRHATQQISFQVSLVDHFRFYDLLSAAVGSGAAPDIALVDCAWIAGLARAGFIYPIEELGFRWDREELERKVYPSVLTVNTFNGKLYGLPARTDVSLLWYRKDWFEQEGIAPPRDWNALVDTASHFLKPQVRARYGLEHPLAFPAGVNGHEATVYMLMPFIWSAGGEILDPATGEVRLDSPETRQALRFLRELIYVHQAGPVEMVSYNENTAARLFAMGKVAMALGGSYESRLIREISHWEEEEFFQRVGCVVPPAAPGKRPASTIGGSSYVILRQCERPVLMLDILRLAVKPEIVGEMYDAMMLSLPYLPTGEGKSNPLLSSLPDMMMSGRARPSVPEYVIISRQLQSMFEAAISSSTPVDEIVQRAAEFIGLVVGGPARSVALLRHQEGEF
ncbi:MAG: extracellular solute-binding protein [Anaerolineae bacterium]|nr:extracellular solute-binding protein [Anaerolineae bacterium]